jgi:pimeloyl-ACP methyl ester carboxylesterase
MIAYNDIGRGQILLLIHGFCEDKSIWSAIDDSLAQYYRVISVDLPGFGDSPLHTDCLSIDYYADSLHSFIIDLVGLEEIIIIGHSLGGYVALNYLAKNPCGIKGIVLVNSTAYNDSPAKVAMRNKVVDFLNLNGVRPFLQSFVAPLFFDSTQSTSAQCIVRIKESGVKINPYAAVLCVKAMRDRTSSFDHLVKSKCPVLYIAGKNDSVISVDVVEQNGLNPSSQIMIFENCGHMCMLEEPDLLLNAIKNFVKNIPSSKIY